jgi:AAA domain
MSDPDLMDEEFLALLRATDPGPASPRPKLPPVLHEVGAYDQAAPQLEVEIVTAAEFAAVDEPGAEPLLGDPDNVVLPMDDAVMVYGDGGAGKTTLVIDLAVHLAAGDEWLGIPVGRPCRVLLIENEGPRPLFRKKLGRKLAAWQGSPVEGRLLVWTQPWAEFSYADPHWREVLARRIAELDVDVIIAGPITAAGMDDAGTLQETRAYGRLVRAVRELSGRPVLSILIHHEAKGGRVSGAWEGVGETLIHVQGQGHGRTRIFFQKARWASDYHQTGMNLVWTPGEGFTVDEHPEVTDEQIAELIVVAVTEAPGSPWGKVAAAVRAALKERGSKGIGNPRLDGLRDGLFAAGRVVNLGKDEHGNPVVLDHVVPKVAAQLYNADDPIVGQLPRTPGADGVQVHPLWEDSA